MALFPNVFVDMVRVNLLLAEASFVAGLRMASLLSPFEDPKRARESRRMVSEKIAAGVESVSAANLKLLRHGPTPHGMTEAARASLKPLSRRVRANRKRLTRPTGSTSRSRRKG